MPIDDSMHVEIRGVLRRTPAPDRRSAGDRAPFGTGGKPDMIPDGSAIHWPGRGTFYFNDHGQRAVIVELWQARERGRPWVNQTALLSLAGFSHVKRLAELFEEGGHPAWGTLIARGPTAGTYGLPKE